MNKEEAIERIKNIGTLSIHDKIVDHHVDMVIKNEVLDIVSQIDEPHDFIKAWFDGYDIAKEDETDE